MSAILLKGPGLIHLKKPLEGKNKCIALPSQYDNISSSKVETVRLCGLK